MFESKNTQKEAQNKLNKILAITISVLLVIIIVVAVVVKNNNWSNTSEPEGAKNPIVKNSDLTIQVSEISEKAKFFPVEVEGTQLEVLAVKAPDGTIRTAFNTCQVCYNSGRGYYVQEGDVLVCQNCGNRFKMDDVEVTRGGCNPVPITLGEKTVNDTSITISKEYLSEAKVIFANWKK